ncbi:MAG: DNA-processing protein DprA [Rickettsiales bacterium]|nr:DNA-processing protein DprA [Rickettsiales bacterium]
MLSEKNYNILRLFRSKNVGVKTFFKLLNFFGDFETAIQNIDKFNNAYNKLKAPIVLATKEEIEREIVACSTIGAKIITYIDKEYPQLLREINDFPPILTTLGNLELLNKESIAIVGSRNASSNGCNFATKLAKELGEKGFVITSGFASGIDTAGHTGGLNTGTIAVLGGGIDNIYPRGNEYLYYEIKNKGLIISEFPFNSTPKAENFPSRNRIVSGLSRAVIIIEAGIRSGTIHTARQALEQNRELLVVPGNPYDERSDGCNKLIKEGATIITSCDDVLENLQNYQENINYQNSLSMKDNINTIFGLGKQNKINIQQDNFENEENIFEEKEIDFDGKTIKEKILLKLNHTPIEIELLSSDLNININILNVNLIDLELEGKTYIANGKVSISCQD